MKLLNVALVLFFFILSKKLSAQGSWNIGYLKIDSLNSSSIGRTFRIDFKSQQKTKSLRKSIRSYLINSDSGLLKIVDKQDLKFIENREIYVDSGDYSKQFLYYKNNCDVTLQIHDVKLLKIENDNLFFEAQIKVMIKKENIYHETTEFKNHILINRNQLEGLIYEINN